MAGARTRLEKLVDRRLDLRLLAPALIAWGLVAATLGWPVARLAVLAVIALGLAVVAAWAGMPDHGRRTGAWRLLGLCAAASALTCCASAAHAAIREVGPIDDLAPDRAVVTVTGQVITEPIRPRKARGDTWLLRVRVQQVTARGQVSAVNAPVLVIADNRWAGLLWHERVTATVRLGPAQPGDDIVAVVKVMSPPRILPSRDWTHAWADGLRANLRQAVTGLPPDARGLIPGLVVGDTSRSPPALTDDMRATGLSHLSAVSGANVAIVLGTVWPMLRLAGVRRRWRPWLLLGVVCAFVVLARPEPSVIRAATMGSIGLLGLARSTRASGIPALAAALVALLVFDPWLARSAGFALSALATLGLLLFVRPWSESLRRVLPKPIKSWAPALVIPVAAQAMCAPVIVLLQGTVSVVGIPANLLVAPLVAPVTIGGLTLAVIGTIAPAMSWPLAWIPGVPALGIAEVAHRAAAMPWANAPWPDGPRGAWLLAGVIVLLLLLGPRLAHEIGRRPLPVAAMVTIGAGFLVPTAPLTWPPAGWQFVACDVGQGDALVLHSGPGHAVLVDAGPDSALIDRCLRRLGITTLDVIVLTHFHADHIDGLAGAVAGRSVGRILVSPVADPKQGAAAVTAIASRQRILISVAAVGDSLVAGQVHATVWWPLRRIDAGSVPNNASIVLDTSVGSLDVLLTGDIEREAAHALLTEVRARPAWAARLTAYELIKEPHHGSDNLDPEFMEAIKARAAVISVAAVNDYGHPAPGALALLARKGLSVWRTDQHGDIAFLMDGDTLRVRGFR